MNYDNNHSGELENKIKEMQTSIKRIHDLITEHIKGNTKSQDSEEYQRFLSYLTYISEILSNFRL
jgi:cytochrome c